MPLKIGKSPTGENQLTDYMTEIKTVNPNTDGSFIVIRIGDYFLSDRFKLSGKIDNSLIDDPRKAYHWQSIDNAISLCVELMRGECSGKYIALQRYTPVGANLHMQNMRVKS